MERVVLAIVFGTLLIIETLGSILTIAIWRKKKFVPTTTTIHFFPSSLIPLFISLSFSLFFIIGGFTFLDDGQRYPEAICSGCLFSTICLPISVILSCSCVFIDGHEVIKRTLRKENKIDLYSPDCRIDDQGIYNYGHWMITIVLLESGNMIQINRRLIVHPDTLKSFLEKCYAIIRHGGRS